MHSTQSCLYTVHAATQICICILKLYKFIYIFVKVELKNMKNPQTKKNCHDWEVVTALLFLLTSIAYIHTYEYMRAYMYMCTHPLQMYAPQSTNLIETNSTYANSQS